MTAGPLGDMGHNLVTRHSRRPSEVCHHIQCQARIPRIVIEAQYVIRAGGPERWQEFTTAPSLYALMVSSNSLFDALLPKGSKLIRYALDWNRTFR